MTKYCIICGEPAKVWSGHIHTNKGTVIAGRCERHRNFPGTGQIKGCDSPNPNSCFGRKDISKIELSEPLTESYLATVKGELVNLKRDDYFKTDEFKVSVKKKSFFHRLFDSFGE